MCNQPIKGRYLCYAILQMIKELTPKTTANVQTGSLGLVDYSFSSCEKKIYKIIKKNPSSIADIIEILELTAFLSIKLLRQKLQYQPDKKFVLFFCFSQMFKFLCFFLNFYVFFLIFEYKLNMTIQKNQMNLKI